MYFCIAMGFAALPYACVRSSLWYFVRAGGTYIWGACVQAHKPQIHSKLNKKQTFRTANFRNTI